MVLYEHSTFDGMEEPSARGSAEEDFMESSTRRRISKYIREWQASSAALTVLKEHVILPESRWYGWWTNFVLLAAAYSSFFMPMEFGFFRGLPGQLALFDLLVQVIFIVDIVLNFFLAYSDMHTYRLVTDHRRIATRYVKSDFFPDLVACLPWDTIYKAAGRKEALRYMLWFRLYRVRKVERFFQRLEKDIRVHYFASRIAKLLTVELYCTHTAACIFYYLATTVPHSNEGYTWIGSLKLGNFTYDNFEDDIDLFKRYVTAMYWAILTMATVGYGDIHAVNPREMIFVMLFVSFDMILGAYLIGNMTALICKGSTTEKFRDKMTGIMKFMNMHSLPRDLRQQMKDHVKLEFDGQLTERTVLKDFPASIRAKIFQALYLKTVKAVPLFKHCSQEFINQLVSRVHTEYFLPGEIITEQGSAADRLYIVSHGLLEVVSIAEDGTEEVFTVEEESVFGEVAILCNVPQPYTVRVTELSTLLRLDKQVLMNIMQIYAVDSRQVLNNLLKQQAADFRRQLADEIQSQLGNQQAELTLRMNNAAYQGDLYYLRSLIRTGADPLKADYCGRTPLHLAASKGHEDIALFLLREGANINAVDSFGLTPLFEAVSNGHDYTSSILVEKGASLLLSDAGGVLCNAVVKGKLEFLKRLIRHGVDPNTPDHNSRTALHAAAAEGSHIFVRFLISAGANIFHKDRWDHTPYDEAKRCGSILVISAFQEAMKLTHSVEGSTSPSVVNRNTLLLTPSEDETRKLSRSRELAKLSSSKHFLRTSKKWHSVTVDTEQVPSEQDQEPVQSPQTPSKTCILAPQASSTLPSLYRTDAVVITVPPSMEEVLHLASQLFGGKCHHLVDENGAEISTVEMIQNSEKLYVVFVN